jgi:magnesium transporter
VWVASNLSDQETRGLREKLKLDEYDLQSALDPDEVPRVEWDADLLTVIWKTPTAVSATDTSLFNVSSIGIFLSKNRLVIASNHELTLAERKHQGKLQTLDDVVVFLLYGSVHHFQGHLKVMRAISTEIQQKVNESMDNQHLLQMFGLGESLVYYQSAISGNHAVLTKLQHLVSKAGLLASREELLEDVTIDNAQCLKLAEIHSQVLSGLMDARGNIVNNNMNVLIKNLTIINVIFLPLNLLASIGGMSEFSMMTQGVDWRISYTLFMLVMALVAIITWLALRNVKLDGRLRPVRRRSK